MPFGQGLLMKTKVKIDTYDVEDDNEAVAPGQSSYLGQSEEDREILKEIADNLKKSRGRRTQWRLDAKEDYDFYAGNQWSEEDAAILREEDRPVVVFNRTIRTINAIAGVEV